ncbi:MAG: SEC-C domain-containing protein [Planctomycetota bacterium]|nr:SEC-C domain-containing protein [Planctomycetota bacterium]
MFEHGLCIPAAYADRMDPLIGTAQCPHLGYAVRDGIPCCHADDGTRLACGKWAPNPEARGNKQHSLQGIDPFYCTVLGKEAVPAEALKLAAQEKARARQQQAGGYRAPGVVTGRSEARASREADGESFDPVTPTSTLRADGPKIGPNSPCICGSGKKYKKCCGRSA